MVKQAKGLGKGLESLFNVEKPEVSSEDVVLEVAIGELRPNPYQPRKFFDQKAIEELKQSIIENGIIQPLIIRKSTVKGYEIVAGERRYRAAKAGGLETVPAVIRDFDDTQMMELALLENLQREDLNPMEEATAYRTIINKMGYTQEVLSQKMGKSRSDIANSLRLLELPSSIQERIEAKELSKGHGRALLGIKDQNKMKDLALETIKKGYNVRELEKIVKEKKNVSRETLGKRKKPLQNIFLVEQERLLRERFGTFVSIAGDGKKGKIAIDYLSREDLERILALLGVSQE